MISKIIFAVFSVSTFGILWIMNNVKFSSVGPLGMMGFFALLFLMISCLFSIFAYGAGRVLNIACDYLKINAFSKIKTIEFFIPYCLALAFAPIVIIAKQSIDYVSIFDLTLIFIAEVIVFIYISKR